MEFYLDGQRVALETIREEVSHQMDAEYYEGVLERVLQGEGESASEELLQIGIEVIVD